MLRLQSDVLLAIFFVYKNSAASSERTGVTSRCVADGRGFRPTFSPDATWERSVCRAGERKYIIDLHRAEFIAGGNGNPAQYNTEDKQNMYEAVIPTRNQTGFFALHIYSVMKTAKMCTFRKIFWKNRKNFWKSDKNTGKRRIDAEYCKDQKSIIEKIVL